MPIERDNDRIIAITADVINDIRAALSGLLDAEAPAQLMFELMRTLGELESSIQHLAASSEPCGMPVSPPFDPLSEICRRLKNIEEKLDGPDENNSGGQEKQT